MRPAGCPREEEVLRAWWTEGSVNALNDDLRHHLAVCTACGEVQALATALRRDRAHGEAEARLPSAGQIWWRSAVRARMEAAQAAARPVTWSQAVSAAVALGAIGALLVMMWPSVQHVAGALVAQVPFSVDVGVTELLMAASGVVGRNAWLIAGAALVWIVGPLLALYVALAGED